jgi:hypothetical protein
MHYTRQLVAAAVKAGLRLLSCCQAVAGAFATSLDADHAVRCLGNIRRNLGGIRKEPMSACGELCPVC